MIRYQFYELERFKGAAPRWYDKFLSVKWVLCTLLIVVLFFMIVGQCMAMIGAMKGQTIEMIYQPEFQIEIKDSL